MKRQFIIIPALFATLISCSDRLSEDFAEDVLLVPAEISAGSENIDGGKASLDFPAVLWEESDRLAVFDGYGKRGFEVVVCEGSSARFRGEIASGAGSLAAVYPYSSAVSASAGSVCVNVPASQKLAPGKVADPSALVAVGSCARGEDLLSRTYADSSASA